jgi:hypothetical protein
MPYLFVKYHVFAIAVFAPARRAERLDGDSRQNERSTGARISCRASLFVFVRETGLRRRQTRSSRGQMMRAAIADNASMMTVGSTRQVISRSCAARRFAKPSTNYTIDIATTSLAN